MPKMIFAIKNLRIIEEYLNSLFKVISVLNKGQLA